MPTELVMLDLDGTLIDSLSDLREAVNRTLEEGGLPPISLVQVQQGIGHGARHLVHQAVLRSGGEPASRNWVERFMTHYTHGLPGHHPCYPGIPEALASLEVRGFTLAVVTNKPARMARMLLEARGLSRYLTAVVGGDTFDRKKPDPLPLQRVMALVGVQPSRSMMVGDSGPDVGAARAAGVRAVAVRWGYGESTSMPAPDSWLEAPVELATLTAC